MLVSSFCYTIEYVENKNKIDTRTHEIKINYKTIRWTNV